MATIVNEPPRPVLPVTVDFYFEQTGPPGSATYDGDIYPYPPLPSDKGSDYRYAWGTTPVFLAVEFFATEHEVESKIQPHVVAPPGVTILDYHWNFGDGHVGHGPIVTHTYEVADPDTEISLTVLDSLGREWSTSKALSLVFVDFGYTYTRIRGVNTETPPKRKTAQASGDFALTQEGSPRRIWIARAGQPVREEEDQAISNDRARATTHFLRSTIDTSLTNDAVKRMRHMVRLAKPEDISLTADAPKRLVNQLTHALDEALTEEGAPIGNVFHALRAALSFIASLIPRKL